MDEARLTEIEAMHERLARWRDMPEQEWRVLLVDVLNEGLQLLTEVRRLQALQGTSIATINGLTDALDNLIDREHTPDPDCWCNPIVVTAGTRMVAPGDGTIVQMDAIGAEQVLLHFPTEAR